MEYEINNKYLVLSQIVIQSKKYTVNKITIGKLVKDTGATLMFETDTGIKRIRKRTIKKLLDITFVSVTHTQFLLDKMEAALV